MNSYTKRRRILKHVYVRELDKLWPKQIQKNKGQRRRTLKLNAMRKGKKIQVHVRIRPQTADEDSNHEESLGLSYPDSHSLAFQTPRTAADDVETVIVLGFEVPKSKPRRQKQYKGLTSIHREHVDNATLYSYVLDPLVRQVLEGRTACCLAYGHTGSGKTHTMFGYNNELGMAHHAIHQLFDHIKNDPQDQPFIQVRFAEIYNGQVYDLLNDSASCVLRENAQGDICIRGASNKSDSTAKLTGEPTECLKVLNKGLDARATGNSNVHTRSSRSHAVLELKIITPALITQGQKVLELDEQECSVGHARDSLKAGIHDRNHVKVQGKWVAVPKLTPATEEEVEQLKKLKQNLKAVQNELMEARQVLEGMKAEGKKSGIGGTLVLVDLAGSEYAGAIKNGVERSVEEQKECREINKILSALKACFRSFSEGQTVKSVYRQSKLTLLLRDHFRSDHCANAMIATIAPVASHVSKTIHTMQYAQLLAQH